MSSNSTQVGGTHYKVAYQHWDYVLDNQIPYLEANATKYITRWRKKNGLEDLRKARHYVEKLLEEVEQGRMRVPWRRRLKRWLGLDTPQMFRFFVHANGLTETEALIVRYLTTWTTKRELRVVLHRLNYLISVNLSEEGDATPAYVRQG